MPLQSILSQQALQSLLLALSFICERLRSRLGELAASERPDDVCEAVTAAVYLISSAASPAHSGRQSRARSFQVVGWDGTGRWQRLEDMVDSGFYYAGDGRDDHVKCFFCDLGLKDWEASDIPEVEHVKFSPLCFFLKSSRGLDWVRGHCARVPNFPASYTRQDHNRLLETICQEFASVKAIIAASVGNNRTAVLLQLARSYIRRKEKLTLQGLVLEMQKELDREIGVAKDGEAPWFPTQFDLATVADEFHRRLVRQSA